MPVCLDGVKWIIGRGGYTSLFHCASDLITMRMNASTYNEPGSEYNLLGEFCVEKRVFCETFVFVRIFFHLGEFCKLFVNL